MLFVNTTLTPYESEIEAIGKAIWDLESKFPEGSPERHHLYAFRCKQGELTQQLRLCHERREQSWKDTMADESVTGLAVIKDNDIWGWCRKSKGVENEGLDHLLSGLLVNYKGREPYVVPLYEKDFRRLTKMPGGGKDWLYEHKQEIGRRDWVEIPTWVVKQINR